MFEHSVDYVNIHECHKQTKVASNPINLINVINATERFTKRSIESCHTRISEVNTHMRVSLHVMMSFTDNHIIF